MLLNFVSGNALTWPMPIKFDALHLKLILNKSFE